MLALLVTALVVVGLLNSYEHTERRPTNSVASHCGCCKESPRVRFGASCCRDQCGAMGCCIKNQNPKRIGSIRFGGVVFNGVSLAQIHLYAGMSISV